MAEASSTTNTTKGNTAVPNQGDHDRVQMLSVRADGTPDQHNPELIGEADATLAATQEQFRQQAVSAADVQRVDAGAAGPTTVVEDAPQDPSIKAVQDEHEKIVGQADKAAASVVSSLSQG
jgi:hypothetical protein